MKIKGLTPEQALERGVITKSQYLTIDAVGVNGCKATSSFPRFEIEQSSDYEEMDKIARSKMQRYLEITLADVLTSDVRLQDAIEAILDEIEKKYEIKGR